MDLWLGQTLRDRFKLTTQGRHLMSFVGFCEERGASRVTTDLAVEWATQTAKGSDSEAYQASSPDYKALLQRVKARNPAVIYFASYLLDASTLMRQASQANVNPQYYTSAGTGFAAAEFPSKDKGAGPYAEYTLSVSQWLPTSRWKGSKEFDEAFLRLTGTHPAYHAMLRSIC